MSSSDSDDDNVIRYGTPLEPLEEDEIPKKRKFQEPAEQYAVDSHGRRRFHGAFTGGFSAGFGNTVGTPEGWTPATFKSSRSEKAQLSGQRPEDFMDEEDRSEFGIAPRLMETRSEFSGQKRPRPKQYFDGTIPGEPVLESLLQPVHETAAVRILRSMGWRPGTGAGGRLTRGERAAEAARRKVYGCSLPGGEGPTAVSDDSDSEFEYETLLAPQDYEPYLLHRKDDRFGLGYSGLSRHSVLGNLADEYQRTSHLVMKDKGKRVSIRGQAFGVGALEADDEDIYAAEDMSNYDFALGPKRKEEKKQKSGDTSNVIAGFVRSTKPLPSVRSYPPPALPRDFTPAPAGARRSRFEPTDAPARNQGLGRHELSAAARGTLLGEEPPQPPEKPTTDPTDPLANDPIAKLLGRNVNFTSANENTAPSTSANENTAPSTSANENTAPSTSTNESSTNTLANESKVSSANKDEELDFISIKDSGKELKMVFKPFASNPAKQTRYERYLRDKAAYMSERDALTDRVSEWERNRELVEFDQAAKLYKPLTGVMGERFTHGSQPDDVSPLTAVARSAKYGASPQQVEAAARGVYGATTRRAALWRPERIVCKRFNVPELGAGTEPKTNNDKPKVSYSIFSYLEGSVHDKDSFTKEQSTFSGSKSLHTDAPRHEQNKDINKHIQTKPLANDKNTAENVIDPIASSTSTIHKRMTVAELFLKESEKNKKEGIEVTETINKFDKMDLYKSIFLSDSEEEEEKPTERTQEFNFEEFIEGPKNVERNNSPPRGIFANIDFDEINAWRRTAKDESKVDGTPKETRDGAVNKNDDLVEETSVYGPKIPDKLIEKKSEDFKPVFIARSEKEKHENVVEIDSSSSSDWVDASAVKTKKLKKKKSKKHKSKHKKHKKKDRK